MSKVLKVGIATVEQQRARSLAIAAGTRQRMADEPNVWFPSVTAMARVLMKIWPCLKQYANNNLPPWTRWR